MSTYEISKSSLLSLKAEILKKQEELQKTKAENKFKLQREIRKKPLELRNKGVESRGANEFPEEEDLLKKSREALEAKSKLYEKLSYGSQNEIEKEHNRKYLVHFDKKAASSNKQHTYAHHKVDDYHETHSDNDDSELDKDYPAENSDEEWVEFVDCFGRTRTCQRKDLETFKKKDKHIKPHNRHDSRSPTPSPESSPKHEEMKEETFDEKSEMLSGDMRRELQRQQWEQEDEQLRDKTNVHYQDILFSEARTHGVGYYGFSKDEETRAKQQAALKNLRKETEQQQKQAQEVRQNRERQMAARIRAARNRKRAREGLPPITSEDEAEEQKAKAAEIEKTVQEPPEDPIKEMKRKMHVRPWDIGKDGIEEARIKSGSRDPYDQEEWNAIQRDKRQREFAPPQVYHTERINPYKIKPTPIRNECSDSSQSSESEDELMKDYQKSRSGANIPPPATFEYYGPSGSKRPKTGKNVNMEDAIMQGLKYLRRKVEENENSN